MGLPQCAVCPSARARLMSLLSALLPRFKRKYKVKLVEKRAFREIQ